MSDHVNCYRCERSYLPRNVEPSEAGPVCLLCVSELAEVGVVACDLDATIRLTLAAVGDLPPDATPNDHLVQLGMRKSLGVASGRQRFLTACRAGTDGSEGGAAA